MNVRHHHSTWHSNCVIEISIELQFSIRLYLGSVATVPHHDQRYVLVFVQSDATIGGCTILWKFL
jgi:hypothetical protein